MSRPILISTLEHVPGYHVTETMGAFTFFCVELEDVILPSGSRANAVINVQKLEPRIWVGDAVYVRKISGTYSGDIIQTKAARQ